MHVAGKNNCRKIDDYSKYLVSYSDGVGGQSPSYSSLDLNGAGAGSAHLSIYHDHGVRGQVTEARAHSHLFPTLNLKGQTPAEKGVSRNFS